MILAEAASVDPDPAGPVLVLDAPAVATALVAGTPAAPRTVLHRSDQLADEADVPADLLEDWDDPRLAEVRLVAMRLPAGLGALDELAGLVAAHCHPDVRLVAGARVRHMTRSMNETLAIHFARVRASLGRQKSRALHAEGVIPDAVAPGGPWPHHSHHAALDLTICAHGGTFAGTRIDPGTRLLLGHLTPVLTARAGGTAVDLGSGSGVLAAVLARAGWNVTGVDSSRAGVTATAATARANGLDVRTVRADGLAGQEPGSIDLVVCNPPFHQGTAKDSSTAFRMIATAGAALRSGGAFWCVYNAHLPYLNALRRDVGPTRIVARDRHYLVSLSTRT